MYIHEANEFIKNYKDPKAKKSSTKLTESKKSLNEEMWDSSRVIDLTRYFLDKYPYADDDQIMKAIKKQMTKEGSTLPSNDSEFRRAYFNACDDYNEEHMYDESLSKKSLNEENKDSKLGSVEDYLDKLNHCKSKSEAEKVVMKAAGNPNASEAYRRWKVMKGLDESKKRMNEAIEIEGQDYIYDGSIDPKELADLYDDYLIDKFGKKGPTASYDSNYNCIVKSGYTSEGPYTRYLSLGLIYTQLKNKGYITESKKRMNESYPSASSYVQPAREAIAAITSLLNMMYEDQTWYDDSSDVDYYEEVRDRLNDLLDWAKQG